MYGAIIGDIVGSRFEFHNIKTKEFELFDPACTFTDDTVMTLAIAQAIMDSRRNGTKFKKACVAAMKELGNAYPFAGYGCRFNHWLKSNKSKPYGSYGNGSAMRVSACGWVAQTEEEAFDLGCQSATVTHSHPDGEGGAMVVAKAIFYARTGRSKEDIRGFVKNHYDLDFTLDEIRPTYSFVETCLESVPQAIEAFLESTSFEDAIRNAISIGGASDTIGAITGSIAEAFYGVPEEFEQKARTYLDERLLSILDAFEAEYCKS